MLEKNDFKALREMFEIMLRENNEVNNAVLRRELRQEMRGMITENNEILRRDIRDEVHSLIRASEHRVISEITDFIASALLPQIDDHDVKISRLERSVRLI